jgi:hypothetical protein
MMTIRPEIARMASIFLPFSLLSDRLFMVVFYLIYFKDYLVVDLYRLYTVVYKFVKGSGF